MFLTYFLYEKVLKISNYAMYASYYLSNLPYIFLIGQYIFGVSTIARRFEYVNQLFAQLILHGDEPEIASASLKKTRPWSSNVPTINYEEIYSIYWNPTKNDKKSLSKSKENVNKEVQKFMEQMSGKQDDGFKKILDEINNMLVFFCYK